MNPNHQLAGSENIQLTFTSMTNLEQIVEGSSQHVSIHSSNQCTSTMVIQSQQTFQHIPTVNSPTLQNNFVVDQFQFFYQPPNDLYIYHVKCEEISFGVVTHLLTESFNGIAFNANFNQNKFIFSYCNNRIYQVTCEVVTSSLIINYLNETIYGIEVGQNIGQEQLLFTFEQEENLKFYLTQYLSYLLN